MFGKGLLVMIAAFGISFAYSNSARFRAMVETTGQAADYQYEALARESAKTGFAMARQAMSQGDDAGVFEGESPDGAYRTVLSRAGSRYRIESQARFRDSRSMPIVWKIYAEYERAPYATPEDVPPFLDYALMSGGSLTLAGTPDVDLSGFGDEENANIHTNSTLNISGKKVKVSGFGTYGTNVSSSPADAIYTAFTPQENGYDRPRVHQVEPIEIPEFDLASYLALVETDMISGPITLSGTYALGGTRLDPYIWYVQGDLDAASDVQFDGYVMFLVDGDIRMSGNVTAGMESEGMSESNLAFYSSGNITFTGNVELYGQFFADGVFEVNGTPDIFGTVTARGATSLKGTPQFNYVEASPALAQIWATDDPDIYKLQSYHEALERTSEDKVDLFTF